MTRTTVLLLMLAAYAAVLGRGPAVRAIRDAGFDPLSPQAIAVEQFIAAGRDDEALPIAAALGAKFPREPQIAYWIASIHERRGRYAEAAAAWSAYVTTSAAPAEACPAWPDAYLRSNQPDRAQEAALRCGEWTRR